MHVNIQYSNHCARGVCRQWICYRSSNNLLRAIWKVSMPGLGRLIEQRECWVLSSNEIARKVLEAWVCAGNLRSISFKRELDQRLLRTLLLQTLSTCLKPRKLLQEFLQLHHSPSKFIQGYGPPLQTIRCPTHACFSLWCLTSCHNTKWAGNCVAER